MKIRSIRIQNYKSFDDSGDIQLNDGMNVIVGQNSSGKTAFLDAFRLWANETVPHRSLKRDEDTPLSAHSVFTIELTLSGRDIKQALLRKGTAQIYVPEANQAPIAEMVERMVNEGTTSTFWTRAKGSFTAAKQPGHGLFPAKPGGTMIVTKVTGDRKTGTISHGGASLSAGATDEFTALAQEIYAKNIFVFSAERYNIGRVKLKDESTLEPNAGNLPSVLAKLNKNRRAFDQYTEFVRYIFPHIDSVTVSQSGDQVEIFVYNVETTRPDLAMPLLQSGTGISQVLAILYVLMTVKGGVIVIDEPNSFLHPGATKKLMQILSVFPNNQYIVSTHATEVVSSSTVAEVVALSMVRGESIAARYSTSEVDGVRAILAEVGSSIADVFGLESVIWVEGQTEQECFPAILRDVLKISSIGVAFVAMRHTADFDRKKGDPREPWEIYDRLSKGTALVPPALAFSFDRDGRSDQQIEDMERASKAKAHFLPRLTYENYLLHPKAIASVVGSELSIDLSVQRVEIELDKICKESKMDAIEFEKSCRAPIILRDLFYILSDNKLRFDKMKHSLALTRWLVLNDAPSLQELADFVVGLVPKTMRKELPTVFSE